MDKIKMAVIGAGGTWGQTHVSIYKEHPLAEVTAICDLNREKAEAAGGKMPKAPKTISDALNDMIK